MPIVKSLALFIASAALVGTGAAGPVPAQGGTQESPDEVLTLAVARERVLAASPDLQALAAQVRAAEGAARQSRAFENPTLQAELEDFGGTLPRDAPSQKTFSLGQNIEWFGKRSARIDAAHLEFEVATYDLERRRRDLLAEVDRRFVQVLGARERHSITEENTRTAGEVTRAVSALVEAGEVSPIEEARAQGDEAIAAIDLASARRDVDLTLRALTQLWAADPVPVQRVADQLAQNVPVPDRDAALAAVDALPDLARWHAEAARRESLDSLARKQAFPDFALSAGFRTYDGVDGHAYVAGLQIPIPLFTQYSGARSEAAALLEQARHERRGEQARVRLALISAHEALLQALEEATKLREQVLPRATAVYEALNEGYRRGKFRLLDLLEARRTLAETRLRYVDALVRLNLADADLRRFLPVDTENSIGAQQ
jgi:cobalt-zinc-cadmium efflux system outer membrane protein